MPDPADETPQADTVISAEIGTLEKNWWESATIRAALMAMLPPVARMLGFDDAVIAPYVGDIVTVVFGAAAIYGRMTAQTTIKRRA